MFIHLRTHSYYSFLEGLNSPAELAKAAVQHGMPALALTDHQVLTGAVEFTQACQKEGIQPILGLEIDLLPPAELPPISFSLSKDDGGTGSLVLLAMDRTGWSSLCRLSSAVHERTDPRPVAFDRLAQETAGLLCLTGGQRSLLTRLVRSGRGKDAELLLQRLAEFFPGQLYVEIQKLSSKDQPSVLRLASMARRHRLPVVATHPIYYLSPEGAGTQRLVTAIRLNQPLKSLPEGAAAPPQAYFLSRKEMAERFEELPVALDATEEIAARCQLELPLGIHHYPEMNLPPGTTASQALQQKAEAGAVRLYGEAHAIKSRLDYELGVIAESGYESLFLMMEEIVRFSRRNGIPISSRGSAASSLVAHCLGITSPDPIRLNLYFERFLNPARATPPDIDTDLCSRRRDEVIHFVYKRYGQDRVAMVGTINRFRRRSALRETAKAHGLPAAEIKTMVDSLPYWRPHHLPEAVKASPFAELIERFHSPLHQQIINEAAALIGIPRHLSVHAGGVVISPGTMTELAPTQLAPKGVLITQFDHEAIEALGLVKIDLLGIRGLTVLGDVAREVGGEPTTDDGRPTTKDEGRKTTDGRRWTTDGRRRRTMDGSNEWGEEDEEGALRVLEAIPEEDGKTSELLRTGGTIGCFQIESPGMRATLREIQARSVDDLMVALALYRPGPLTGGLKDAFVRRHRGEEPASQLHPALTALLADTYGVILYQEQVLRIAHELAGLSLADADLLRRAMSHFDPGKQMIRLREKFIAGATSRSGVPEAVAARVWELMAAFAGYGFPKAHAASYAQVGWRAAWCKVHYPAVFMSAVLANWGGYYPQSTYLMEARRMGLALRPPHINHASREFSVVPLEGHPVLFMGLDQVRDLTRRTQARILSQRPFHSLNDFLARADPRPIEAENLVRAGALEGLGGIPALLHQLKGGWQRGQLTLFSDMSPDEEDWPIEERVAAQEAILGAGVTASRLELFARQIAEAGAVTTVEAAARLGGTVRVAGVRQTWHRSASARGSTYFMSLEDLEGMLEVIISEEVYRRSKAALKTSGPYLVEGSVELNPDAGEPFIRAVSIERLEGS